LKELTGDLLKYAKTGQFDVIIHGCNCFHTMGAGIAKQIKEQFPNAYAADCETKRSSKKLGSFSAAKVKNDVGGELFIVNAYTQFEPNPPVDYEAIASAFKLVKKQFSGMRIGYPMIGAGLAGGDWEKISAIIDTELEGEDHSVVIYAG